MPFDPDQPRDEQGRWTETGAETTTIKDAGEALKISASDIGRDADELMIQAEQAMPEIQQVAEMVAEKYGATVTPPNLKSKDRIIQKANDDYGGDVSLVKDAARNTIVVSKDKVESVVSELSKLPGAVKVKRQTPETDPLGYSGTIINYRAKNGLVGEIQVNTPEMIYAKEPAKFAKLILGNDTYEKVNNKYNNQGGIGHKFYEQYRSLDLTKSEMLTIAAGIEEMSRQYYSNFFQ